MSALLDRQFHQHERMHTVRQVSRRVVSADTPLVTDEPTVLPHYVRAAADVVAVPAASTPDVTPEGECQIAWADTPGITRLLDLVAWRRLDQGPIKVGQEFALTIQARASRDLRLPLHTDTARLILTLDPADSAEVVTGDVTREDGWLFGVRLIGVRLAPRLLPLARPVA
jgi:hypothetical protein